MAATMSTFATFINSTVTPQTQFQNFYSVPITGGTVTLPAISLNQWAVLQPAGTLANLSVVLPGTGVAIDGQLIVIGSTQIITALTVNAGTSTMIGAGTSLSSITPQTYKYIQALNSWMRIS
jgi:hypothetical protein